MNIILGVTGSISAYKTYDLLREFLKEKHEIVVVLTKGAERFINPQTFKYLGAKNVYSSSDDFLYPKNEDDKGVLHINLAKWCDRFIIAPLSANTLSKLVVGSAEDLLTSIFLSLEQKIPKIMYPAMNTNMYYNHIVQKNLKELSLMENHFVHPPTSGLLACGDNGIGKLPEISVIAESSLVFTNNLRGKNVLITTGATVAPLDPVRYLTNPSTGITGYNIAKSFLIKGCNVTVIAGSNSVEKLDNFKELPNYKLIRVKTTKDMHEAVMKRFPKCDLYISSAAISDIKFNVSSSKLKKEEMKKLSINFNLSPDILSDVIKLKKEHQKIVGFAAETDLSNSKLQEKLERKPVDLLVGTLVSNGHTKDCSVNGFQNCSAYYSLMQDGVIESNLTMSKSSLGNLIAERVLQ